MKPYYEDVTAGIVIYHGDCRDVLPTIESGCMDALITDPPYGIVNRFGRAVIRGRTRTMQFDWDQTGHVREVIGEGIGEGIGESIRTLKKTAAAFVFAGMDTVELARDHLRAGGFVVKPAAWVKKYPPPAMKGNWWPSGFELAMYAYRNSPWFGDDDPKRSNVFVHDTYRHGQPGKVGHPTQKPLGLMRRIVGSIVPPGGVCVDPFMGSGTTLVAAKDLGRKAVGIEVNEQYCELAAERLRQSLFNLAFSNGSWQC